MAAVKLLDHHSRVTDTMVGELQPYMPGLYVSFFKDEYKIVAVKYQFLRAKA